MPSIFKMGQTKTQTRYGSAHKILRFIPLASSKGSDAYIAFESPIHKVFVYCPKVFVNCLKREDISEAR